jgi:hypothetical protein
MPAEPKQLADMRTLTMVAFSATAGVSLPRKDLREPQGALQIPPLRFAPVGMTILLQDTVPLHLFRPLQNCHPDRSVPEFPTTIWQRRPRVRLSVVRAAWSLSAPRVEGPAVSAAAIRLSSSARGLNLELPLGRKAIDSVVQETISGSQTLSICNSLLESALWRDLPSLASSAPLAEPTRRSLSYA